MEIDVLRRRGMGIRAIARELGVARNTVRAVLDGRSDAQYGPRSRRPTKLGPHLDYLRERLATAGSRRLPATVLLREVRERGYDGGITQLKDFLMAIRPTLEPEPIVRFETAPGEQMQIDFVVFRRAQSPLRAFTASLGFSRMAYAEFVDNERAETWISCLQNALSAFGGTPNIVLCDNPKAIVLIRDAYGPGKHQLHPLFRDFTRHYGLRVALCRPYRAQTKGKVERFHRYLRESFYWPLQTRLTPLLLDAQTANREVRVWLDTVANVRCHATLRERPVDRFAIERSALRPLPEAYGGKSLRTPPTARPIADVMPVESIQHSLAVYEQFAREVLK